MPGIRRLGRACGFTLVELLVVITIILVLAAMMIPAYSKIAKKAAITKSLSNLQQLHKGFVLYSNDNQFCLPAPYSVSGGAVWQVSVFPYLYPNKPMKSDSSHLLDTVFISPNARKDCLETGKTIPDATVLGYGMNRTLPSKGGGFNQTKEKSLLAMSGAGATMLLIDNRNGVAGAGDPYGDDRYNKLSSVAGRYDGKLTLVYCDGHADLIPLEKIPASEVDVFWRNLMPPY